MKEKITLVNLARLYLEVGPTQEVKALASEVEVFRPEEENGDLGDAPVLFKGDGNSVSELVMEMVDTKKMTYSEVEDFLKLIPKVE